MNFFLRHSHIFSVPSNSKKNELRYGQVVSQYFCYFQNKSSKIIFCLKHTPASMKLAAGYKESQLYSFPFEQAEATTSCKSTWDTVTVFWHKWPVQDLVLVILPTPLIKVASNTRPCSKIGEQLWRGAWGEGEGGQYYISQTCDQQQFEARKVIFHGRVSTVLQLVVACTSQTVILTGPLKFFYFNSTID